MLEASFDVVRKVDIPGKLIAIIDHLLPGVLPSSCIPSELSGARGWLLMLLADFEDGHLKKAPSGLLLKYLAKRGYGDLRRIGERSGWGSR